MKVELSKEDLFLIEMSIDEAMWNMKESSPFYERLRLLNQMIYSYRHMEGTNDDK